ncbi:sensor histidine kinase [Marinicella litoralis]|uniref:histidine kinase n=1 Tax=Marinicella litoralis TaxID=644220 RepID=A0A4R6XT50_9GAMM|nr:sensor histidine kinase [Marinicella litoralis]TDR19538.1 histidine kinase/DNA gyrase B/HSP90-like ATPase [Marinicella litoralis]
MKEDANKLLKEVDSISQIQKKIVHDLVSNQQQMKQLAKRILKVQEDERKHIAQELHDSVGQLLTAVINQLESCKQDINNSGLGPVLDLTRQALLETRELSRLMRPRILDDLGLVPALCWLTRIMSEKNGVQISLDHEIKAQLDPEIQTLVFRVVQESLTNALKHAQAKSIQIIVKSSANVLVLKIIDDGIGMDNQDQDGFGMATIQDRVFSFDGQLIITSALGQGTEIKVILTSLGHN